MDKKRLGVVGSFIVLVTAALIPLHPTTLWTTPPSQFAKSISTTTVASIAFAGQAKTGTPRTGKKHTPTPYPTITATVAPTPSATATPTPTATPTTMPTPAPTPTATPGWVTVLDDEFTNAGIPSHWSLYNGPYGSGAHNCAAPSQDSAPGDGYLYLTMSYLTSGKCGAGWYTGGMMVSSAYDYPQQAVTIRYRIIPSAASSAVYSHHVMPMLWPDDPNYQWYQAEADLCESSIYTGCTTYLHYTQSSQISHSYTVDLTQWHTMRFEQVNGTLAVYLDGVLTWYFSGGTSELPNAMRRLVLQQECPFSGCPSSSYVGNVEQIQVDYVTLQVPG